MIKFMNKLAKFAFTLAEVLIVLGIIGIVAEVTIPTLVQSYQKQVYVTQLKKTYVEFNQALLQLTADKGCPGDLACTGIFSPSVDTQMFGTEIVKYFKVAKNCESTYSGKDIVGCFSDIFSPYYNGGSESPSAMSMTDNVGYYRFIAADGSSYSLTTYADDCATWQGSNSLEKTCGELTVDVNGRSKPNRLGRDIFSFYITNGKGPQLYPFSGTDTGDYENRWQDGSGTPQLCIPENTYGAPCTARIMEEGWKMNY